jgi:hypothetical protein
MEYFNPFCTITFNDFLGFDDFIKSFSVSDTFGKNIYFKIFREDSSSFKVQFNELSQKFKLVIKIDFRQLTDFSNNKSDTVITKIIETNSESDYGNISGYIKSKPENQTLKIEAKNVSTQKSYHSTIFENKYLLKYVIPGSYLIKLFVDESSERKSVDGYSKPFIYYPDTIKVKSRWPTTDVNFDANQLFR